MSETVRGWRGVGGRRGGVGGREGGGKVMFFYLYVSLLYEVMKIFLMFMKLCLAQTALTDGSIVGPFPW